MYIIIYTVKNYYLKIFLKYILLSIFKHLILSFIYSIFKKIYYYFIDVCDFQKYAILIIKRNNFMTYLLLNDNIDIS